MGYKCFLVKNYERLTTILGVQGGKQICLKYKLGCGEGTGSQYTVKACLEPTWV